MYSYNVTCELGINRVCTVNSFIPSLYPYQSYLKSRKFSTYIHSALYTRNFHNPRTKTHHPMYYTEPTPNFPPSCTPHTSSISHSLFSILTCYTLPSAHAYKHITHPSSSLAKRIIVHGGIVSGPKTFARAPRGGLFRPTYRCPRGGYKASTSRVYIYKPPRRTNYRLVRVRVVHVYVRV